MVIASTSKTSIMLCYLWASAADRRSCAWYAVIGSDDTRLCVGNPALARSLWPEVDADGLSASKYYFLLSPPPAFAVQGCPKLCAAIRGHNPSY